MTVTVVMARLNAPCINRSEAIGGIYECYLSSGDSQKTSCSVYDASARVSWAESDWNRAGSHSPTGSWRSGDPRYVDNHLWNRSAHSEGRISSKARSGDRA